MGKWYVYILRSLKDGGYYIGHTSDLERRLEYHNSGKQRSTRHRTPFELVYYEEFTSRSEAVRREKDRCPFTGLKNECCYEEFIHPDILPGCKIYPVRSARSSTG